MKQLITLLLVLISLNCYSQGHSNFDVDSTETYFLELINNKRLEVGKVFEGKVITRYVRRFWEKKGKFVNDTIWERWETYEKLEMDSALTLCAEHHVKYLILKSYNYPDSLVRITHHEKDDVDNYNILETFHDRGVYYNANATSEIAGVTAWPNYGRSDINKWVAESMFNGFYTSEEGHQGIIMDVRTTKIGISIEPKVANGFTSYIIVCNFN
jgi:hypothetical protein